MMVFVHAVRRAVTPTAFAAGVLVAAVCTLVSVLVQVPIRGLSQATREAIPLWAVTACRLAVVAISLLAVRSVSGAARTAGQG